MMVIAKQEIRYRNKLNTYIFANSYKNKCTMCPHICVHSQQCLCDLASIITHIVAAWKKIAWRLLYIVFEAFVTLSQAEMTSQTTDQQFCWKVQYACNKQLYGQWSLRVNILCLVEKSVRLDEKRKERKESKNDLSAHGQHQRVIKSTKSTLIKYD